MLNKPHMRFDANKKKKKSVTSRWNSYSRETI